MSVIGTRIAVLDPARNNNPWPRPRQTSTPEDAMAIQDFDDIDELLLAEHEVVNRARLGRVVFSCAVMLDPRNQCVDPEADTIEHHPDTNAGQAARKARPLAEWHEDLGDVLWWRFPVDEAPWCGTPHSDGWPNCHTHWTPLVIPAVPVAVVPGGE